jgi:hypothetical protein
MKKIYQIYLLLGIFLLILLNLYIFILSMQRIIEVDLEIKNNDYIFINQPKVD